MKRIACLILALLITPLSRPALSNQAPRAPIPAVLRYLSPSNGSQFVQPGATIALRLDDRIDPASLSAGLFSVVGSVSGAHAGLVDLADDGRTVVFKPRMPFVRGESVLAALRQGLGTRAGTVFPGAQTRFTISAGNAGPAKNDLFGLDSAGQPGVAAPSGAAAAQSQKFVTIPSNFPAYTVTVPASGTAPGFLFLAPINLGPNNNFLLIAGNDGQPLYWQETSDQSFDFKRQPDGSLTYFSQADSQFHVLDSSYHETRAIAAANGYTADLHELLILPNGHALFLINDFEITSTVDLGGYLTTTVIGLVIQEVDTGGLPVFQWDSWSHFAISDTYESVTAPRIDYVHANALEIDSTDQNLLLSSRHMSEITKINYEDGLGSGDVIWRLGGKNNQFAITDAGGPFSYQHDIRRLPNGNLTIFDNHNPAGPSRAVEYQIDETAKVITNTWQFSNTPTQYGPFTGNNQWLPNGNRLIGWGFSHPNVTEVLTNGAKAFELDLIPPYFSYRAFRFPWAAVPEWAPTLVLTGTLTKTLYYSWNGATDVASYNIYGGVGQAPNVLLGNQPRTGFEDHTALADLPSGYCAFRVQPLNHAAQAQPFSNVVLSLTYCPAAFFPFIFR